MSFACMTIFTQNIRFSQMLLTLGTVSRAAWPLIASLVAVHFGMLSSFCTHVLVCTQVTCIYARTAHEIFAHKVLDDYGTGAFFGTYGLLCMCCG